MAAGPGREPPAGHGDWEGGFWGAWGAQPALPPRVPSTHPALPRYGWPPPPAPGLLAQPVSAPRQLPGGRPLLLPGPLLCAPIFAPPVNVEEPPRARAAARESTAALKAWLGRHRRNPYPSKGEKALLALASRLSPAQVSTWFANARRRLRREGRAAPRPPPAGPAARSGAEPRPRIWRVAELALGAAPGAGGAAGPRSRSRASPGQAAEGTAGRRCACGRPQEPDSRASGEEETA